MCIAVLNADIQDPLSRVSQPGHVCRTCLDRMIDGCLSEGDQGSGSGISARSSGCLCDWDAGIQDVSGREALHLQQRRFQASAAPSVSF